jgi:hypothetical protein
MDVDSSVAVAKIDWDNVGLFAIAHGHPADVRALDDVFEQMRVGYFAFIASHARKVRIEAPESKRRKKLEEPYSTPVSSAEKSCLGHKSQIASLLNRFQLDFGGALCVNR